MSEFDHGNKLKDEIHWPPLRFMVNTQSTPNVWKITITSLKVWKL